jgi:hypothetical protein
MAGQSKINKSDQENHHDDGGQFCCGPAAKKGRKTVNVIPTVNITGTAWRSTGYSVIQPTPPAACRKVKEDLAR